MNEGKAPARILIVDDHPMVREGIAMRISTQPDLEVCGDAESEDETLLILKKISVDLVIVDLSLKSGHGLDLIKQVKCLYPEIKMLVVSGFEESLYGERSLRAGATGYLNKQASNEMLIKAIQTVLSGQRYISSELSDRLVTHALGSSDGSENPIEQLSNRELEIFRMIGHGHTSGAIAERLFLSPHTIDTHRENVKRKLGARNAAELTRHAVLWVLDKG